MKKFKGNFRYTVRAENRWGLGEMRTARMWIKPMQGKGSRPPSSKYNDIKPII